MNFILRLLRRKNSRLRHSADQSIARSIINSVIILFVIFGLHVLFMMQYEGLGIGDSLWLTLTTATTVGYGDISATSTEGRIATVLLIYMGGIFILAKVVGDYFDYRLLVRERKTKGYWSWNMDNHIVILNIPLHSGERYLQRLIMQFRASDNYQDTPIYLLTRHFPDGLPDFITKLGNIVHYNGNPGNLHDLEAVCVTDASDVIVLTNDENDDASDGVTFDILHRLKELKVNGNILVECVEDSNRKRLEDAGANIVIRPIRAYPEMIVRAFDAPGSERIIENMFNSEGDEYRRYNVDIKGMSWCDIVTRLITHDAGIAVAYIDKVTNDLVYNPPAQTKPDLQALITISKDTSAHNDIDVKQIVS